ncbi:MAG: rhodanese-like domain-containing protein [Candidatus Pacearchaeota archaeon]
MEIKEKKTYLYLLLFCLILGALGGTVINLIIQHYKNSDKEIIKEFYLMQNKVYVSPHSLRTKMDKGIEDYILVDLRSQNEYEKEHIVGAINIPVYKDEFTPDYDNKERIIEEFSKLPKNKEVIVYCYSTPCMSGRKIGLLLAENGIYVKHLGIGWNEWRYYWKLWNHEPEWNQTDVKDYIATGKEPGKPLRKNISSVCSIEGGC